MILARNPWGVQAHKKNIFPFQTHTEHGNYRARGNQSNQRLPLGDLEGITYTVRDHKSTGSHYSREAQRIFLSKGRQNENVNLNTLGLKTDQPRQYRPYHRAKCKMVFFRSAAVSLEQRTKDITSILNDLDDDIYGTFSRSLEKILKNPGDDRSHASRRTEYTNGVARAKKRRYRTCKTAVKLAGVRMGNKV